MGGGNTNLIFRANAKTKRETPCGVAATLEAVKNTYMGTATRLGGLMDQRDEDWRDTLFYWHGKLSWVGGERQVMSWRGSWLSTVSNALPPPSDFSSSFNFFELNFDVRDPRHAAELSRGEWRLEHFFGLSGAFRGHYLMEPPDGTGYRRAYRDENHEFCFDLKTEEAPPTNNNNNNNNDDVAMEDERAFVHPVTSRSTNNSLVDAMMPVVAHLQQQRQHCAPLAPGPYLLCCARGQNEFGSFVALGHARRTKVVNPLATGLCPAPLDDGLELTLARRYVRDDDSRLDCPLPQLLASVTQHGLNRSRVAPWEHSLPCRLPSDVIAATQRRDIERQNAMADNNNNSQPLYYQAEMLRKRPRD